MKGLRFEVGCPNCGSPVRQLAPGRPAEFRSTCMVECTFCAAEYQVTVELSRTRAPKQIRGRIHAGAAL